MGEDIRANCRRCGGELPPTSSFCVCAECRRAQRLDGFSFLAHPGYPQPMGPVLSGSPFGIRSKTLMIGMGA
jgi:hypothetical protein